MTDSLSGIIRNVANSSSLISSHSTSLADLTVQTSTSIEKVVKTVEELAKGASGQTSDAKTGYGKLLKLAEQINSIMVNTVKIEHLMNRTIIPFNPLFCNH